MEELNKEFYIASSSPNIIPPQSDEGILSSHIATSVSENIFDSQTRNKLRMIQMKRKKENLSKIPDNNNDVNDNDDDYFESRKIHSHDRYSENLLHFSSKHFTEEDDSNDDELNIKNDSLNEITTSNTNENNVEVIVSDLDCDLNEEDSDEENKPNNKNNTLIAITKAQRAQNSFIKINNKLRNSLDAYDGDKKTCSYMMALGGDDSKVNYEVDSIIEEEDENNHEMNNEGKCSEIHNEMKAIDSATHKASKSEMINIDNIIEKIQQMIDREIEENLMKKQIIKNNLIEYFSGEDKEINVSHNSQALSYEISIPITISIINEKKKKINTHSMNLIHVSSPSLNMYKKKVNSCNYNISSLPKLNSSSKKPSSHTHNKSHQCSLLLHDMRKNLLIKQGKAQSLYLKKTLMTEDSITQRKLSKRIRNCLTFNTKPNKDSAVICHTMPNESHIDETNKAKVIDGLSTMQFPASLINHQRFALDKVKKSRGRQFAVMLTKEKEFRAVYEIKSLKNTMNRVYGIGKEKEIVYTTMMMTLYKYDKGTYSRVGEADNTKFNKCFIGNIIGFSINESITRKKTMSNKI